MQFVIDTQQRFTNLSLDDLDSRAGKVLLDEAEGGEHSMLMHHDEGRDGGRWTRSMTPLNGASELHLTSIDLVVDKARSRNEETVRVEICISSGVEGAVNKWDSGGSVLEGGGGGLVDFKDSATGA